MYSICQRQMISSTAMVTFKKGDILLLCARSESDFFKHSSLGCKISAFYSSEQEQVVYLLWVSMFLYMLAIPGKSWRNSTVFLTNLLRENNYQYIQWSW